MICWVQIGAAGCRLQARRSGPGEIGSVARQPRRLEVLEEVRGVSVRLWGWSGARKCGLWEMKFFRQVCGPSKGTTA